MDDRTITIAREDGDTFSVTVTPPVEKFDFDLTGKTQAYASSYARSLERHHGWLLVDLTRGGLNG